MQIHRTLIMLCTLIFLVICCNEEKPSIEGCYQGSIKQDVVTMKLHQNGDSISGQLEYNFYEKDKNSGTVTGSMVQDSLLLFDYQFKSEGSTSMRQVAFVIEDNKSLTEVHGEMSMVNDGLKFKDITHLKSGNSFVLNKITCESP